MKYEIKYKENNIEYFKIIEGKTLATCAKKYEKLLKMIHKLSSEVTTRQL